MESKTWKVWMEGFLVTGMEGISIESKKLGEVEAETFHDACQKLCASNEFGTYDPKRGTVYGCRLFDNENDAKNGGAII